MVTEDRSGGAKRDNCQNGNDWSENFHGVGWRAIGSR